jgi:prevent-host-death family protein
MQISIAQAHNRLSYWLNKVNEGPITITRRGKPVGVIISPGEFERLRQFQAYQQVLGLAHSLRESGITARELYEASREELEHEP